MLLNSDEHVFLGESIAMEHTELEDNSSSPKSFDGFMEAVVHCSKLNFLPEFRFKMKINPAPPMLNFFSQSKDLGKTETNAAKGLAPKSYFLYISATIINTRPRSQHSTYTSGIGSAMHSSDANS